MDPVHPSAATTVASAADYLVWMSCSGVNVCLNTYSLTKKKACVQQYFLHRIITSTTPRFLFYGGLVSIVPLEVFAEPCDLGQGMREAINNSRREGVVFWANFKKLCHLFNWDGSSSNK